METLDIFSVRDLRTRSGDLLKDAELGEMSPWTILPRTWRPS
jgi:hypothetical protein